MKNKKRAKKLKKRDWKVLFCFSLKSGAFIDKKKERNRNICRKKVQEND